MRRRAPGGRIAAGPNDCRGRRSRPGARAGFGLEGGRERKAGGGLPRSSCRETLGTDQEEAPNPRGNRPEPAGRNREPKPPQEPPVEAAKPNESFLAKPSFQRRREPTERKHPPNTRGNHS